MVQNTDRKIRTICLATLDALLLLQIRSAASLGEEPWGLPGWELLRPQPAPVDGHVHQPPGRMKGVIFRAGTFRNKWDEPMPFNPELTRMSRTNPAQIGMFLKHQRKTFFLTMFSSDGFFFAILREKTWIFVNNPEYPGIKCRIETIARASCLPQPLSLSCD